MNSESTEQMIQDRNLNAQRITPAHIQSKIVSEDYYRFPDTMVTICCLKLENGYHVTGESACVSARNFNKEVGNRVAKENAEAKIWALEGYLLRQGVCE